MGIVRATLLVLLVAVAGCHRWVPHDGTPIPAGTDVRVRVTGAGSDDLRRRYGPNDGSVTGPVAYWNSDAVAILNRTILRRPGFPATVVTDTIAVPSSYLAGVDVKVLDRKRTALVTAGVVAGSVGAIWAARAFGGDTDPGEGEVPPPDASIGIRLPIGFGGR